MMEKSADKKKNNKIDINNYLTYLRAKMFDAITNEDMEKDRIAINEEVENLSLSFSKFEKLDVENMIFFLNNNSKFAIKTLYEAPREKKKELLDKLLTLDMSKRENVYHVADFIMWACGYIYEDKEMSKLVKKFCESTGLENTNLLFDIKSILLTGCQEKCKSLVVKRSKELKQTKKCDEDTKDFTKSRFVAYENNSNNLK